MYVAVVTFCSQQPLTDDVIMAERQLSEQRPNVANRHELLQLTAVTRKVRRQCIAKEQPSITEILRRYPRLLDINETVPVFTVVSITLCRSAISILIFYVYCPVLYSGETLLKFPCVYKLAQNKVSHCTVECNCASYWPFSNNSILHRWLYSQQHTHYVCHHTFKML